MKKVFELAALIEDHWALGLSMVLLSLIPAFGFAALLYEAEISDLERTVEELNEDIETFKLESEANLVFFNKVIRDASKAGKANDSSRVYDKSDTSED